MNRRFALVAALALSGLTAGCSSFGPHQLRADQVDYARALGDAKKREILSTIIGLRYADAPSFLTVSSIIAAYTFSASTGATVSSTPPPRSLLGSVTGTTSYGNSPTFTFTPTTGEGYASAYIRPMAPALVLPLADSGIPIDLLLRIVAQSVDGLQNATMLGGPNGDGSPDFFALLRVLRRLQLAGELSIQYRETNKVGRVSLLLGVASGPEPAAVADDVAAARRLLGLSGPGNEFQLVAGAAGPNQIAIVTRSVLGILSNLGAEVPVPQAEIDRGATTPTVRLVGGETRPTIVVHVSHGAPGSAYVAIAYNGLTYWIDQADFDSKYAFTVLQNLMALAEISDTSKAPIITIPAG